MSILIVVIVVLLLLWLEKRWLNASARAVRWKLQTSRILAEPGEELRLTARVDNTRKLLIPFVRLHLEIPAECEVSRMDTTDTICRNSGSWWHIEERFSLRPLQRAEKAVFFTAPSRGVYHVGKGRLTVGDLLGFREEEFTLEPEQVVVMPERSRNTKALDAAGGFLGDISVRRFIMEDPILITGFRDYTGREPMRAISWTRTAMTGELQVKQFDYTAEKTAVVLLNTRGASGELLEECLRMTRSVCEQLEKSRIPFSLRTNGNLPGPVGKLHWVPEGLGESHLNTILFGLGRADATCFFTLATLIKQTLRKRKHNDAYIVITPPLSPEDRRIVKELENLTGNPVCVLEVKEA